MEKRDLGIGLVGYKFMGQVHSNAYRQVARFFDTTPSLPCVPSVAATRMPSAGRLTLE